MCLSISLAYSAVGESVVIVSGSDAPTSTRGGRLRLPTSTAGVDLLGKVTVEDCSGGVRRRDATPLVTVLYYLEGLAHVDRGRVVGDRVVSVAMQGPTLVGMWEST